MNYLLEITTLSCKFKLTYVKIDGFLCKNYKKN